MTVPGCRFPALVVSIIGTLLLSAEVGERVPKAVSVLWPLGLVTLGGYFVVRTQS